MVVLGVGVATVFGAGVGAGVGSVVATGSAVVFLAALAASR
jgi:hypothetical protein